MFHQQRGCRGVLFVRMADGSGAGACSFWENQTDIDQLATSPTYLQTVARLLDTGMLTGVQQVAVFEIVGGGLDSLIVPGGTLG